MAVSRRSSTEAGDLAALVGATLENGAQKSCSWHVKKSYVAPKPLSITGKSVFLVLVPVLWKSLPNGVKNATLILYFSRDCKAFLFRLALAEEF